MRQEKNTFEEKSDIVSSQLFDYAYSLAEKFGWEFGGPIAGHLIGQFPHERIPRDKVSLYVHPDSHLPMGSLDEKGQSGNGFLRLISWIGSTRLADSMRSC